MQQPVTPGGFQNPATRRRSHRQQSAFRIVVVHNKKRFSRIPCWQAWQSVLAFRLSSW
jgi:hypothetical protein